MRGAVFAFLLAAGFCAGCGYTTRSMLAGTYRTIHIEPFLNKVDITSEEYTGNKYRLYKPMVETDVTRAVVDRFLFDGNLRPVPKDSADLVLRGELMEFRRDPLRYTEGDEVEEYRISVLVNLSLQDPRTQKIIWEERNFTGETSYFTKGSLAKTDDAATGDAIADLARRIVERTIDQW